MLARRKLAIKAPADGPPPVVPVNPGVSGLVAWWPFNESVSRARQDYWGHAWLAEIAGVGQVDGLVGKAATFNGSSQYLSTTTDTSRAELLQLGDVDFVIGGWVYRPVGTANAMIICKDYSGGSQREYGLMYNHATAVSWRLLVGDGVATINTVDWAGGVPELGQWHFVLGWHDKANNKICIRANHGIITEETLTITPGVAGARVDVGARYSANYWNGHIQNLFIYKGRLLSEEEQAWLYNDGLGRHFAEVVGNNYDWWHYASTPNGSGARGAYTPIGARSKVHAGLDWSGRGRHLTEGGTVKWNAKDGFGGFSVADYLSTGFNPGPGWSMANRFKGASLSPDRLCGAFSTINNAFGLQSGNAAGTEAYYYAGSGGGVAPRANAAVLGVAGGRAYRNGVDEGLSLSGTQSNPGDIWIGEMNGAAGSTDADVLAHSNYNVTLTAPQVQFVHNKAAALTGGWWNNYGNFPNAAGAWQAKGAASQAESYIDLSGNGNDLAIALAPSWSELLGWTFNGVDQYLRTGVIPLDHTWTLIVRVATSGAAQGYAGNTRYSGGTKRTYIGAAHSVSDDHFYGCGTGPQINISPRVVDGVLAVAGLNTYYNGVAETPGTGSWDSGTEESYIGAINSEGAPVHGAGRILAAVIFPYTLTPLQVATISDLMRGL